MDKREDKRKPCLFPFSTEAVREQVKMVAKTAVQLNASSKMSNPLGIKLNKHGVRVARNTYTTAEEKCHSVPGFRAQAINSGKVRPVSLLLLMMAPIHRVRHLCRDPPHNSPLISPPPPPPHPPSPRTEKMADVPAVRFLSSSSFYSLFLK